MTTNIKDAIYRKDQLWSNNNGRDYIKIGDEIYSINGLYCDEKGEQDRWGQHVRIMDIRWTVVVWQDCWLGRDADFNPITEKRLQYKGDDRDMAAMAHWGYKVERDQEGYNNVTKEGK